jgi:hypothetical protein
VAIGGRPSTGAAPQLLQLLELDPPSTTAVAEEKSIHIQSAINHITRNQHRTFDEKG